MKSNNMTGGYILKQDNGEPAEVLGRLEALQDKDVADYQTFFNAATTNKDGGSVDIPGYESYAEVNDRITAMTSEAASKAVPDGDSGLSMASVPMDDDSPGDSGDNDVATDNAGAPDIEKTNTVQVTGYETLEPGTVLYHPSIDVGKIGSAMILVDTPKVMNHNEQRSFSVFFTPSEEYARRFSGLWSLNKRPVFVHKVTVKDNIPLDKIKVIDADTIPDNIENLDFAKRLCGDTIDGFINGIKVNQKFTDGQQPIAEYYVCNPALFFKHEESWMQFRSAQWIKISPENTSSIIVPASGDRAGTGNDGDVSMGDMSGLGDDLGDDDEEEDGDVEMDEV